MKAATLLIGMALALPATYGRADEASDTAMLAAHNGWRAQVGVDALSYSPALAASAQAWAEALKKHHGCQPQHSDTRGSYGENLYWASARLWSDGRREMQQVTPEAVVNSWAAERADYRYATNSCKPGKACGHYTQIIWKNTRQVGCGRAVCDNKDQIWVCRYAPAGNWVGQKPY